VTQPLFEMMRNEISRVLEAPDSFAVAQVLDIRAPAAQPLDTVREQVRKDLINDRARKLAEQRATEFLQAAKGQKNLEAAAKEQHLQAKKTGEFSRKKPDDTLRLPADATDQVFLLTEAQPFGETPLHSGNTLVVCQLLSAKAPAADAMGEERAAIRKRLLQQKQEQIWQAWLEEQRKRADVKILHEL
jgi:peptidyl-prolyl cis-trans isomerase D